MERNKSIVYQPLPPNFIQEQYGHLLEEERPKTGPAVDVRKLLKDNKDYIDFLNKTIYAKRIATQQWVEENYPGMTAVWLTRPFFWREAPDPIKQTAAEWIANIISSVYGKGYPLPNKYSDFNLDQINNGSLLPYFGMIGPPPQIVEDTGVILTVSPYDLLKSVSDFLSNQLAVNPYVKKLIPVATASIILNNEGFAELGRTASRGYNNKEFSGFEGAPTSLERVYDWLRNRHRLLEMTHTLTSDVRAAEAHGDSPSAGGVQTLILRNLGMKIVFTAPLYNVNGFEPFISVRRPRSFEEWQETNMNKTIYTTPGPHESLLAALWKHQLGMDINLVTTSSQATAPHPFAIPHFHGNDIYAVLDVYDDERKKRLSHDEIREVRLLPKALNLLFNNAPIILAKVEAETAESAATQKFLIEQGFVVCGIEPGYNFPYLQKTNGDLVVQTYNSPPYIYLARLGNLKPQEIAQPFFLDPKMVGERNFGYDANLRNLLKQTHYRILGNI